MSWINRRSQAEIIVKEASTENVDSLLKLYGTSQTSSAQSDKYSEATKSTDMSPSRQSVYDIASIFNDLPRTLDPNQDKLAITNQDERLPEINSSLKQAPSFIFFTPKLNGAQMFSGRHTGNQEFLSLDKIDITNLPVKQEDVKMPTEKKMENVLYYEGISSYSQNNYDPPWLFGVEAPQSANCFKIYSKKNYDLIEPPQYQLHQLKQSSNYQDQSEVPHNYFIPRHSRGRPVGHNHTNDRYNSRATPGNSEHFRQTLPQTYNIQNMLPRKYKPAYKQQAHCVKSNPQPVSYTHLDVYKRQLLLILFVRRFGFQSKVLSRDSKVLSTTTEITSCGPLMLPVSLKNISHLEDSLEYIFIEACLTYAFVTS